MSLFFIYLGKDVANNISYITYNTPRDDGLTGHAKNLISGKYRFKPAFQDMILQIFTNIIRPKYLPIYEDTSALM